MKKDLAFSLALHISAILALVLVTPFQPHVRADLGDVITVSLKAMPLTNQVEAMPIPQVEPPQAIIEDEYAVIPDPKAKSVTKPKDIKPKEKKEEPKPYNPDAQKGADDQAGKTDGTTDVSENLGAGSKFGSASVDNASFDYPYWFVQAFSKISYNWSNPIVSNRPISCVIYFQVIRSGRVIKIEVEESSGIDAFDRGCMRAIELSKPLPPLPGEFVDEIIGIHLTFPYSPN